MTTSIPTTSMLAMEKLTIMEMAAKFERTFDEGNLDEHMTFWAKEPMAVSAFSFESPYAGNFYDGESYLAGIKTFYEQMQAAGGTRHLMTNYEITITDDKADMISYLTVINKKTNLLVGVIRWTDELIKEEDGWKFVTRKQII